MSKQLFQSKLTQNMWQLKDVQYALRHFPSLSHLQFLPAETVTLIILIQLLAGTIILVHAKCGCNPPNKLYHRPSNATHMHTVHQPLLPSSFSPPSSEFERMF